MITNIELDNEESYCNICELRVAAELKLSNKIAEIPAGHKVDNSCRDSLAMIHSSISRVLYPT